MSTKLQKLINDMNSDYGRKNLYFGNFLDDVKKINMYHDFRIEPDFAGLSEIDTSYVVATVHKLLNDNNYVVPKWVKNRKYVLEDPYFAINTNSKLKLYLLYESPVEFKMRNLFVSKNAIERA